LSSSDPSTTPAPGVPQVTDELSRDLKLFHIIMMGLGMMIGAGVFVGIGLSVVEAGPGGLLLTFGLNGLIALFTAMSFAELASAIPRAGGAYNYARIGFGRGVSFIAGWVEWFASSMAGAFYAIVFATFTVDFLFQMMGLQSDSSLHFWAIKGFSVLAAATFIFINFRGSSETGKIGAIFTVGQMLFVVAIAIVGIFIASFHPERLQNFRPFLNEHTGGWWALLGTMGVIYVAFEGFEVIAQAGDETIDPKRNLPKAMLYSVLIVTVTYVLVAFASMVAIKTLNADTPTVPLWFESQGGEIQGFRASIQELIPGIGGLLVTLAVIFSSTSALNATIYSATRASYALGRDGMLPPAVAKIHPKFKTPVVALAMTGVIVVIASVFLNPKHGAAAASMMFLCLFLLVNLCALRIRYHMGDEMEYGFLMPLFPLFPILAIIAQFALAWGIFKESAAAWILAAVWVPAGAVVYLLYARRRTPAADHEVQVLEEAPAARREDYHIMVALANPANALEMVRTTYRLCGAKSASVELLHMVPVPSQVHLVDAKKYMAEGKEGILETMLYLAPMFPLATTLRYCRNISRGIISADREKKADLLILGWHGKGQHSLFKLGSTIDPIIERCHSKVAILKNCGGNRTFGNILVPVAGGPNSAFATEIASILAEDTDERSGQITLLTIANSRYPAMDLEAFLEEQFGRLQIPSDRISLKTVESDDVAGAILAEAENYDLLVLGCSRDPVLKRVTQVPLPERIARTCDVPLIMVNDPGQLRSWFRRWI
jgi:basic amino acid/polyamine antiporter, APA family